MIGAIFVSTLQRVLRWKEYGWIWSGLKYVSQNLRATIYEVYVFPKTVHPLYKPSYILRHNL